MISFDQARKALDAAGITMSNLQLHRFLAELLPNPQCAFSVSGVVVYGDRQSIEKVKDWQHSASTIKDWRSQLDAMQSRAIRAEELGIKLLNFILDVSADNPAAIADVRVKFYDCAHPTAR